MSLCPVCLSNGMRQVWGSGPQPCESLFLGEGPGWEEVRDMRPFVGKSGRELNGQYLPLAGLMRDDVRVFNATLTAFPKLRNPEIEEARECSRHHLPAELRVTNPEYIVTLGAVALKLFGDYDLDLVYGRPLANQRLFQWEGTVFPQYHPAAGLHQSIFMLQLREGFRNLWLWRHGKLKVAVDEHPEPDYRMLRTPDDFYQVLFDARARHGLLRVWEAAIDTETLGKEFWCLTFSVVPGTGYMIRADNAELLRLFREWIRESGVLVIYHNRLFDEPVLGQAEIRTPRCCDTMQEAFDLGLPMIGLKVLAYRLCGMTMQEYDDLVLPYAEGQAVDYLTRVATPPHGFIEEYVELLPWKTGKRRCSGGKAYGGKHPSLELQFKTPEKLSCPLCAKPFDPPKMERSKGGVQFIWDRASRILDDTMEKGANPIKRWNAIPDEERWAIEAVIGTMPRTGIDQVPLDEAIRYACRDADATLRIKPIIRRMSADLGRRVRRA